MASFCLKVPTKVINFSKKRRNKLNRMRFKRLRALRGSTKVDSAEKNVLTTTPRPSRKTNARRRKSILAGL